MVLAGKDQALHAGLRGGVGELGGVEIGRGEHIRRFVAEAPFLVGERVDREMHKADELHRVPLELTRRGHGKKRIGRLNAHDFIS